MARSATYDATRDRVEAYFDRTATRAWEALTSEAPVSRIRQTVRAGRAEMRARMLGCLPDRLTGMRVLDAGCGTGAMSVELALRGAEVVGVDISPELIRIAEQRLPERLSVSFHAGDMLDPGLGRFDAVIAMDSLIYYDTPDLADALQRLDAPQVVFTVAPRTPLLMAMFGAGKLFPQNDRSPVMQPQAPARLSRHLQGLLVNKGRVTRGFYISECLEYRR